MKKNIFVQIYKVEKARTNEKNDFVGPEGRGISLIKNSEEKDLIIKMTRLRSIEITFDDLAKKIHANV